MDFLTIPVLCDLHILLTCCASVPLRAVMLRSVAFTNTLGDYSGYVQVTCHSSPVALCARIACPNLTVAGSERRAS